MTLSPSAAGASLDVGALPPESSLPPREPFEARDGTRLWYRHYPSRSDTALVLLHGSAADSRYLSAIARDLADSGAAAVYTPDVRGHGPSPARRGDIDYIAQLEDDLADLIRHIEATRDDGARVVVGGHSSGGGLAVRFAGGEYRHLAAAYLLLAPYLGHDAPTVRHNSGGWAEPSLARIIPIALLNRLGITRFNDTPVLRFHLPPDQRDGTETLAYSYRLMTGFAPADVKSDLATVTEPLLLVVGAEDEAFFADAFEPTVRPLVPHAEIAPIEDVSHLGVVADEAAMQAVRRWLQGRH